jgi:glucokinase
MYLGVDIGGTKTLVAVFETDGTLKTSQKFPTPTDYQAFLTQLDETVTALQAGSFAAAAVAMPGAISEDGSIGLAFGNLPWTHVTLQADCQKLFGCPVLIENDAKLAGLSEANLVRKEFKKVLYVTISTGIGYSLIINGVIDQNIADGGGRTMLFERDGKLVPWESFASGKAIVERYGKRAADIDDPDCWQIMSQDFAVGLIDLIAILQPEVIIVGGGVGSHFKKFEKPLKKILSSLATPLMPIPVIRQAQNAEEAVIYGCYDLLKEKYGSAAPPR